MEIFKTNEASVTDAQEIYELIQVCAADLLKKGMDHWSSYYDSVDRIKAKFAHGKVFVMRDVDGRVVGTVSLSTDAPEYYIDNHDGEDGSAVDYTQMFAEPRSAAVYRSALAIHPDLQNQKLGKQMIQMTEEWARITGIKYIRFDTRNAHLLDYYARNGYKVVGQMPDGDVIYYLIEKEVV